ncbi:ribonuclease J [Candidatus Pacearchaeota archaeon]|nr:ribonuclease J [Candidatus Pacearchaeota archaeon]|tara:strand:- start:5531 stop:6862 length:1332 start_codon:yes stop_codon:yes gene_type:complete
MVKIYTVGGVSEVTKNMTVVEYKEDAFIFDCGFFLPAIVKMEEKDRIMTERNLKRLGAVPEDSVINHIRDKVCAQFVSHAHLDHVGAIPFLSDKYKAPIYGTPFTMEVLKSLLADNELSLRNKQYSVKPNTSFFVQGKNRKYKVDFINITHSTAQCVLIALHTPEGVILYGNDFKMDDTPVLGKPPNYKVLREIAEEGVLCFVVDALYSGSEKKTPSEKIARALLEEVMLTVQNRGSGMIVTTFSSHIARLKSIVEFGKKLNREVVFLGRSLDKYSNAAKNAGIAPFLTDINISKYRRQVEKMLHKVEKNRKKYLVVCTGHQGEPGSILERLSRHQLPFRINKEDNLIFSSSVIPVEGNIEQFAKMEARLKKSQPRIFRDAHVSGHPGREDLRDILKIVKAKHVIPSHGGPDKTVPMISLANELGYKRGKNVHIMADGGILKL